jgi:hypothetical protein
MKNKLLLTQLAALALLGACLARAELVTVTNDVFAADQWYATNTYLLKTVVYVHSNAVLSIEPGTVIKAAASTNSLISRDGIPNLTAALWVARGGKLYATGTVSSPIIFTSEMDPLNGNLLTGTITNVPSPGVTNVLTAPISGLWGGLVVCGNGRLNSAQFAAGNDATNGINKYERFEGTTTAGTNDVHYFGGSDDLDDSGIIRYVSIRYPGVVFAPAREMNGLTMGGVGSGTTIDHVEVICSSDDGFEWWGGSVNTKYLVAAFCEDDDFDTDQGYRGTNQFWFGIKPPWQGSSDSRGFETDGDLNQGAVNEAPISRWLVYNATLIGRGTNNSNFGGNVAWNTRDEAAPSAVNSIFAAFTGGLLMDIDGVYHFTNSPALAGISNSIFSVVNASTDATGWFAVTNTTYSNNIANPLLRGIGYTNALALNPRLQVASPAFTNVRGIPSPLLTAVPYRGAFGGPTDGWADGWTALSQLGFLSPAESGFVIVTNDIVGTETWYATNTYLLKTVVYVHSNAVLNIQPGTVIKASTSDIIGRDGVPNLVAALWVARGGKLYATGTVTSPITFTIDADDVNDPYDIPYNTSGRWGGLVLCGRARINSAQFAAGNDATNGINKYERFEGTTTAGVNDAHYLGGSDDLDDSGIIRYVSIRYPGTVFAPARELNGLTMGAVGSGTTIEYVEVLNSSDDGFEWWGGTVNTKYLVAAFCEDDDFDTDQGYRGTNQFWFGIKPPWAGSSDSRGFETDGDLNQGAVGEQPVSKWLVYNATLIGRGTNDANFGGGIGWNARDEAAPTAVNSIFTEFRAGLLMDTDGVYYFTNVPVQAGISNSIFGVLNGSSDATGWFAITNTTYSNSIANPLLKGISYTNDVAALNPRPQIASPAFANVRGVPSSLLKPTVYRGAFGGPTDDWADNWTGLSQMGFLVPAESGFVVVTNDIVGTETWYATNQYLLKTVVYVHSNAVLNIQPGTVIKASTGDLIGRDGVPNLVSALWVARGGKLYATGTVSSPIIFTIDADDLNNAHDLPYNTSGKWGGVVLCGRARINSAQFAAGNDATNGINKYERFEGTTTAGVNDVHYFGGSDDLDDSGIIRYVSIRYPGTVFAPARELNGLTMGAVGSGTTIEYVEVLNSSDDGFEWWGGTVSTKHLVAAFCEDDDFDTDQGYRGTNQFWFGIKPPWAGSSDSRGFETDGDLNQGAVGEQPVSQWKVFNATLIGRGTNDANFGGGIGWNTRDEAAPTAVNSIFSEFRAGLLMDVDGVYYFTNNPVLAGISNCLFGVLNGSSDGTGWFVITNAANENSLLNPFLTSISYTNDVPALNPRPVANSPALTNVLSGGPIAVDYRGAFGPNDTWADGWSGLSSLGFLASVSAPAEPVALTIALNGLNVDISFTSESGFTYTLESTSAISPTSWAPATGVSPSNPQAGTGSTLTFTVPASGEKYFRVSAN